MKKLRLNKLFHWLYAFLMFFPILAFFGTVVVSAFNNTLSLAEYSFNSLSSNFWDVIDQCTFSDFYPDTAGLSIKGVFDFVFYDVLGLEDNGNADMIVNLLSYWSMVSIAYLIFDVVMYPINLFHRWIDEGGI